MFRFLFSKLKKKVKSELKTEIDTEQKLDFLDEKELCDLINEIQNQNRFELIPRLFEYINFPNFIGKRSNIFNVIISVASKLNPKQLLVLDKSFRVRDFSYYSDQWKVKDPLKLFPENLGEKERVILLGVASFHSNGYFREKCLDEISKYKNGDEIPFLIIRLNDWVDPIHRKSKSYLLERINEANIENVFRYITLFNKINDWARTDNTEVNEKINNLLLKTKNKNILISELENENSEIRRICYHYLLKKAVSPDLIINKIIKDKNPFIRLFVINELEKLLSNEEFYVACNNIFIKDKYYKIRLKSLEIIYEYDTKASYDIMHSFLLDSRSEIREFTREKLNQNSEIDFRKYYIEQMSDNLYLALLGLGDIALEEDLEIIKKYAFSEKTKLVKSCLKSIVKLNLSDNIEIFYHNLLYGKASLSNYSRNIIIENISEFNTTKIYELYKNTENEFYKLNCFKILRYSGKWKSLIYILEALNENYLELSELAKVYYLDWLEKSNRRYAKLNENDKKLIFELIANHKKLTDKQKKELRFLIR